MTAAPASVWGLRTAPRQTLQIGVEMRAAGVGDYSCASRKSRTGSLRNNNGISRLQIRTVLPAAAVPAGDHYHGGDPAAY